MKTRKSQTRSRCVQIGTVFFENGRIFVKARKGIRICGELQIDEESERVACVIGVAKYAVDAITVQHRRMSHLARNEGRQTKCWVTKKCHVIQKSLSLRLRVSKIKKQKTSRYERIGKDFDTVIRLEFDKLRNVPKNAARKACWVHKKAVSVRHNLAVRCNLSRVQIASIAELRALFDDQI